MSQYMAHITQSSSTLPGMSYTVDDDESSPSIPETQPTQKKVRRQGNFTVDEDIALISTWLDTSVSTRKGTDQKGKTFWTGITKTFCDNTKIDRTDRSVNCRFAKIQKSVNEFSQIVAQLDNSGNSEYSELDKIQEAKSMYRDIHKSAFKFEHCWNILRNQPKWKETEQVAGRKKQTGGLIRSKDSPTPPSPDDLDNEVDNEGNFIDLERSIETKTGTEKEGQEKGKWENDSPLGSPISDCKVQKLKEGQEKRKWENDCPLGSPISNCKVQKLKEGQEKRKWENDCPLDSFISDWKVQKLKMHDDKMKIEQEKMEMAKRNEELRIMTMDMSNFDDDQKEYIMILRANIMDKSRNQL